MFNTLNYHFDSALTTEYTNNIPDVELFEELQPFKNLHFWVNEVQEVPFCCILGYISTTDVCPLPISCNISMFIENANGVAAPRYIIWWSGS